MVIIRNRPYTLTGGINRNIRWNLAKSCHETLALVNTIGKTITINLRNEVKRTHGILRCRTFCIPFLFYFLLQLGKAVGILLHIRIAGWNADIINENTELADT